MIKQIAKPRLAAGQNETFQGAALCFMVKSFLSLWLLAGWVAATWWNLKGGEDMGLL